MRTLGVGGPGFRQENAAAAGPRRLRQALALLVCVGSSGCFALFSLDDYKDGVRPDEGMLGDAAPGEDVMVLEAGEASAAEGGVAGKRVFVSSLETAVSDKLLTDEAALDAFCASLASQAKLPGTYLPWISTSRRSPRQRFAALQDTKQDVTPLVTSKGERIAGSYRELFDQGPQVPIAITEKGDRIPDIGGLPMSCVPGSVVWTGTNNQGGLEQNSCNGWDNAAPGAVGRAGRLVKGVGLWTSACDLACNNKARIYCFEQ